MTPKLVKVPCRELIVTVCNAGDVTIEEPSALSDIRGGLFCDEPVRSLMPHICLRDMLTWTSAVPYRLRSDPFLSLARDSCHMDVRLTCLYPSACASTSSEVLCVACCLLHVLWCWSKLL